MNGIYSVSCDLVAQYEMFACWLEDTEGRTEVDVLFCSPSRQSYEDTYNTLSYADRAKKIKAVVSDLSPQL